jgi:hypothetical protein
MLDIAFKMGDDAVDNEGMIVFEPLSFMANAEALQFRISNFDIPEFSQDSYVVHYKTQEFEKPKGNITTPKEFTFTFRVDKYWTIYDELMTWKQLIGNDDTGAVAEDVSPLTASSSLRTNFSVFPMDSNGTVTYKGWKFTNAWIKNLGSVSFDQTSTGEVLNVSVTLSFVKCIPGSEA